MSVWVITVGWLLGWLLLWRMPALRTTSGAGDGTDADATVLGEVAESLVTVVVPARNEAERLPVLLRSLAAQDRPVHQVVVVDDRSDDATAAVASGFPGVEVVTAPPAPVGWAGKPWACATGARLARGDVLIFLDADVDLAPSALRAVLATWSTHGGLLSVLPRHRIVRPVEALSLPFNVVSAMGLGIATVGVPTEEWGAAGPCMVTARDDYERVGGHSSVAGEVAEDLALAERYRTMGLPVACRAGGDQVRYRMYRDLGALIEGWSKNVVIGARRAPLLLSVLIAVWVTSVLTSGLVLLDGPAGLGPLRWAALYAAVTLQLWVLGRRVGRFGPAAILWPLLMVGFVGIFALSAVRTLLLREVGWRGRRISVAGGRR